MAVDTKIDQIEINGFTYDIDLPPDATPSIAGLTVSGNVSVAGADVSSGTLKLNVLQAKTGSSATTYGVGTSGQVLKSNGTNAYWGSDSSDTTSQGIGGNYKWKNQMAGYQIFITDRDNKLVPMVTGASGSASNGTSKTMNTQAFDPFGLIGYTSSSSYRAADALCSNSTWLATASLDLRYSFNCGSTLTANAPVYIVAQVQSNGMATLSSPYYTQTLPSSADGKIYIYLGQAISTTNLNLQEGHPVYQYINGALRLYTRNDIATTSDLSNYVPTSRTVNSKALSSNITLSASDVSAVEKTTYEYNKEISFGSSGYLKIGSFPMYDSNITIDIDSTTSTTYHATVVIATQNVSTSSMGSAHVVSVYGDASDTITSSIRVTWASGSRNYNVFFVPAAWSKNLVHIRAMGLDSAPSDVCVSQEGTAPTSTSGLEATNVLKSNFASTNDLPTFTLDANGVLTITTN